MQDLGEQFEYYDINLHLTVSLTVSLPHVL